jgi:hypothetical protein
MDRGYAAELVTETFGADVDGDVSVDGRGALGDGERLERA